MRLIATNTSFKEEGNESFILKLFC